MRYLNPIGKNEKFISKGVHTCYRSMEWHDDLDEIESPHIRGCSDEDGFYDVLVESGVKEEWVIHELPDGTQIIRADRRSHKGADNGMHVLGTLLRDAEGRAQRMHMHVYVNRYSAKTHRLIDQQLFGRAVYTFYDDHVIYRRQTLKRIHDFQPIHEMDHPECIEMALPIGYDVILGRITIGLGKVIESGLQKARSDMAEGNSGRDQVDSQRIPVFYPANEGGYYLHFGPAHILQPVVDYYAIEPLERVGVQVGDKTLTGIRVGISINYADGGGFDYDAIYGDNGIMLRNGTGYEFHLTEFVQARPLEY